MIVERAQSKQGQHTRVDALVSLCLFVLVAGCARRPVSPCPLVEALPLNLRLSAAFSVCEGASRDFRIELDDHHVGDIEVPCADIRGIIRAPPRVYSIETKPLAPGVHRLAVFDVATDTRVESEFGLPALVVSSDGKGVFVGSNVRLWVDDDGMRLDNPEVFATPGL